MGRKSTKQALRIDLPISSKIYLSETVSHGRLLSAVATVVNVDVDVGFPVDVDVVVAAVGKPSSIFPSDARSPLAFKVDLALYPITGSSLSVRGPRSVTPVRRREDTDRDGDAGVKVQIDWLGAS